MYVFWHGLFYCCIFVGSTLISKKKMKTITRKLDKDERQEIGITITNKLIELG